MIFLSSLPSSFPSESESKAGAFVDADTNANNSQAIWRQHLTPNDGHTPTNIVGEWSPLSER